jgi:hypothetical protein
MEIFVMPQTVSSYMSVETCYICWKFQPLVHIYIYFEEFYHKAFQLYVKTNMEAGL